jgi:TPR repeat protein
MKRFKPPLAGAAFLALVLFNQPCRGTAASDSPGDAMRFEQKHFLECLAYVYSPALWISYEGGLYFATKDEAQDQRLKVMKDVRARYIAFTDRKARWELAAGVISKSGVQESQQAKLLLPFSATNQNQNLTPTLSRPLRVIPSYVVLQSSDNGDALIKDDSDTEYFVLGLGHLEAGTAQTNAFLIKEGWKTYTTPQGTPARVEAFTSVSLNAEEIALLTRVAAAFRNKAVSLGKAAANTTVVPLEKDVSDSKAPQEEFEGYLSRANDSSPYFQYLVAKCYLEGKGTAKNEKLGLEWMKKAAANGSGDAESYLKR